MKFLKKPVCFHLVTEKACYKFGKASLIFLDIDTRSLLKYKVVTAEKPFLQFLAVGLKSYCVFSYFVLLFFFIFIFVL